MSHYTTTYSGLEGARKQQQALNDIKQWLGSGAKFRSLTAAFRSEPGITQKKFTIFCGLAGIQFYPVIAFWDHCFPDRPWIDEEDTGGTIKPEASEH